LSWAEHFIQVGDSPVPSHHGFMHNEAEGDRVQKKFSSLLIMLSSHSGNEGPGIVKPLNLLVQAAWPLI